MNLHIQEIESLSNSLREREKYVTELENRLRALWDKLEGERKYYMEQICRLEEESESNWKLAESAIGNCADMSSRIKRLEEAGDALMPSCFDRLAKLKWKQAKEAKP